MAPLLACPHGLPGLGQTMPLPFGEELSHAATWGSLHGDGLGSPDVFTVLTPGEPGHGGIDLHPVPAHLRPPGLFQTVQLYKEEAES